MIRSNLKKQSGMTLIEILIVVGVIAILAVIVFVATNPKKNFNQSDNARRWLEVQSIAGAVKQYEVDHRGNSPVGLSSSLQQIGQANSGCEADCGSMAEISHADSASNLSYYSNNTYTIRQQFSAGNFSALTASVILDCDGSCNGDIVITVGGVPCETIPASSIRTDGTTSNYSWYTTNCNVDSGSISNPFYVQLLRYTGSGTVSFMMEESNPTGNPQFSTGGGWTNDNGDYFLKIGLPAKTPDACLNLGSSLVDQYFAQMPVDPKDGSQDKTYYAIAQTGQGSVKVVACHAENNEQIEVVR